MKDEVIGIAILDMTAQPQQLWMICRKANGHKFEESIPVYPQGTAKPCDPAWAYKIEGNRLSMSPSVHSRYQVPPGTEWITHFHNEGQWSVEFRALNETGRNAEDLLRELNPRDEPC